jgi:hypothetical protein
MVPGSMAGVEAATGVEPGCVGDDRPRLCVVVDTEEEFDWTRPPHPSNRSVTNIAAQPRAHEVFDRYGIVPTYLLDHPVVEDDEAVRLLKSYLDRGRCSVGAHLHPWVAPPYEERLSPANTYPGNLSPELERAKLTDLTERIERAFGRRPTVYKAGRYGLGPATADTLVALGYRVDASAVPFTSFAADGGPDFARNGFARHGNRPGPLDPSGRITELPVTSGFAGRFRGLGPYLFPRIDAGWPRRLRLPGVLARSGLVDRIRLSPETASAGDHVRLLRALWADGVRTFSYTYHSPSLAPGNTPYVPDETALRRFLNDMDRFFDVFFGEFSGVATTPEAIAAGVQMH